MPRTNRRFKRRGSRRFSRRIRKRPIFRRRRGRRTGSVRRRLLWPKSQFVKLRYTDIDTPKLTFNGTTDTQPSHRYNLNSAYDPNATTGSSAIPGFSQYAAMYRFYKVMGTKITCTFFVDDPTYNEPLMVGILMRDFALGAYTVREWASMVRSNNNSIVKMLIPAYKSTKVSMYRSCGQVMGNPLEYKSSPIYGSLYNQNPSSLLCGYIFASTAKPNEVSPYPPAITVWCKTEITYYVKFWQYKYPMHDSIDLDSREPGGDPPTADTM